MYLLQGSLNLAFELCVFQQINLIKAAILDPSTLITEPTNTQEGLVARDLILKGTTDNHRDTMAASLGPEVDTSTSVLVVDDVDWIAATMLRIHLL